MEKQTFVPSAKEFGFVIKSDEKCGIEDYLEAVAKIIEAENIISFGRIRSNFGVWVKTTEAAEKLQEIDLITVKNESLSLWPFVKPIQKVKLFNVPPFVTNEAIETELEQYGTLKSKIAVESLFGVSEKFKNIESFTRATTMSFESNKKLPSRIKVRGG